MSGLPRLLVAVENENHCDFVKLREVLLRTNMEDLRDQTHIRHYELYRRMRLEQMGFSDLGNDNKPVSFQETYEQKRQEHLTVGPFSFHLFSVTTRALNISGSASNTISFRCFAEIIETALVINFLGFCNTVQNLGLRKFGKGRIISFGICHKKTKLATSSCLFLTSTRSHWQGIVVEWEQFPLLFAGASNGTFQELQRKEDEMRQMFVVRVKDKEAELKEAEKEVSDLWQDVLLF